MAEFDDTWHEEWYRRMEEGGGTIIAAMRMRLVEDSDERVVMELPISAGVIQGTGVFAAGALIQLADAAASMLCARGHTVENPKPFPLSVQISANLLRNTSKGKATSESRIVHGGRALTVVESHISDEDGRLMCIVTSTHLAVAR